MAKRVLTDADLNAIKSLMEVVVEEKLEDMEVVTRNDIKHLPSKDEFYARMDQISDELTKVREEQAVLSKQVQRHDQLLKTS
ncbi:hypothetical protein C4579_04555 [Candidatus Microgenomates bacterium]|nr:MAG: hypothetical protein C4579_04555 [Candidatus Microgenomates bacterium]